MEGLWFEAPMRKGINRSIGVNLQSSQYDSGSTMVIYYLQFLSDPHLGPLFSQLGSGELPWLIFYRSQIA